MVLPVAKEAAIIKFSVPVTVAIGRDILAPFNFFAFAKIYPSSTFIDAPMALRPSICRFTGREPIAHPPGNDTFASPKCANKGPRTRIDARIVLTISYGA